MNRFNNILFNAVPIIGIVRNHTFEELVNILPVYTKSRLTTLEITMNTPGAAGMINYASRMYKHSLNIGAGTVCSMQDLEIALEAGASFIVMPIVEEEVIKACAAEGIPVFPGAMTPTEIALAWRSGAEMVKVFPAATLGANYFKDVLGPLAQVKLMATGGIDLNNMDEFWKAGAKAFGIGSPLFLRSVIGAGDWKSLEAHFTRFADKIRNYKIETVYGTASKS